MATAEGTGIKTEITHCIGNTPLVRLHRISEGCVATLVGKNEGMNPRRGVTSCG